VGGYDTGSVSLPDKDLPFKRSGIWNEMLARSRFKIPLHPSRPEVSPQVN
jgi:hypothetical protein